jgi:hypothetical protein
MDNHDKIFDKFKEAAHNSEQKDFPGMEKIWSRVEDKLDKKEAKKSLSLWKKIAVAASFLLFISLGVQFLKSEKDSVQGTQNVVIQENEKPQKHDLDSNEDSFSTNEVLVTKEEAVKIIENHSKINDNVAFKETTAPSTMRDSIAIPVMAAPIIAMNEAAVEKEISLTSEDQEETTYDFGYLSKSKERAPAKVAFASKKSQTSKSSEPLIVVNGSALANSNEGKRNKMMQASTSNFKPENLDSLVVLEAPLYIIDGIYYSENDLFGTNPTSPYAPLNKQDIKTITILRDLEATEKYGEKGKKGVVIITTKTGRPALKK